MNETKSLIGKKLIENFKRTIKELMEDLINFFPKYKDQLSIASIYLSTKEEYEVVNFMLLYIDNIIVKNIEINEQNLSKYIDSIVVIIEKIVLDTLGTVIDKSKIEKELVGIKNEINEQEEAKKDLLKYWNVCNGIVKKYISYTPILREQYNIS